MIAKVNSLIEKLEEDWDGGKSIGKERGPFRAAQDGFSFGGGRQVSF